jgi:hypothetical protein
MLIAAGATAGAGLVANAFRIYTVTIPCQTDSQNRCSGPWVVESMFAWGFNQTSIVLAAVGGHMRGRHDATHDSDRHRTRKSGAITAGAVLLATGVVANIVLRSVWLHDYVTPEGPEAFDFALMGHSIAYYGGLQVSSLMVASGLGALTYGAARPRNRQVFFSPSPFGLQVHGRF